MKVTGKVLNNIQCDREATLKGREVPLYGSILFLVEVLETEEGTFSPLMKSKTPTKRPEHYKLILEISYRNENSEGRNFDLISELQEKDIITLTFSDDAKFWLKNNHLSNTSHFTTSSGCPGKVISYFVKVWGDQDQITEVEHIDTVSCSSNKISIPSIISYLIFDCGVQNELTQRQEIQQNSISA